MDTFPGETIIFLTNNFELEPLEVAKIYKARCQIKLFYKWIQQNLRIKSFYGPARTP